MCDGASCVYASTSICRRRCYLSTAAVHQFQRKDDFSCETLQLFLNGKHNEIALPNVLPWKSVVIDIRSIQPKETRQQTLGLFSQKKLEGLDVDAFLENRICHRDRLFYQWIPGLENYFLQRRSRLIKHEV